MNILVIHETEYLDKVVFEYQIVPEILASRGHNVTVIDFNSNWKKQNFFDFGTLRTTHIPNVRKAKKEKGITLIRPGFLKIPVISRLMAAVAYWWIIPQAIKKNKIECIVLYSAPTNGIQTLFWAKHYNIPVFFRLFDVLHLLVPSKLLRPIAYKLEQFVYSRVNALGATTPKLVDYAVKLGSKKDTSFYLPTGSDADLFSQTGKNPELMKKLNLSTDSTIIFFAGTLYNFSGLDWIISYMATHPTETKHIQLVIAGSGEQKSALEQLISQHSLQDRVKLVGFIQYEELGTYMNLADISINPFDINDITRDIIPGKIYQYLACGTPVIATRLPGMLHVFPEGDPLHAIRYCNEKDGTDFFKVVEDLQHSDFSDTNPTLQEIASRYESTLSKLIEKA